MTRRQTWRGHLERYDRRILIPTTATQRALVKALMKHDKDLFPNKSTVWRAGLFRLAMATLGKNATHDILFRGKRRIVQRAAYYTKGGRNASPSV